jgi:hypothetical protein
VGLPPGMAVLSVPAEVQEHTKSKKYKGQKYTVYSGNMVTRKKYKRRTINELVSYLGKYIKYVCRGKISMLKGAVALPPPPSKHCLG